LRSFRNCSFEAARHSKFSDDTKFSIAPAAQSAILGMHGLKSRPMVIDGEVVPRPMVYIALTVRAYDAFGLIESTF
jgi:pyruvate/2-oxoglutarate dehydrogenase complex dihydrolipoamide acyltransferase (E2) component